MSIAQNNCLYIPNTLQTFLQTEMNGMEGDVVCISGILLPVSLDEQSPLCPKCQHKVHVNNHTTVTLWHLSMGKNPIKIRLKRHQYLCSHCHHSFLEKIPFKADHHFLTKPLQSYIEDLLSLGTLTLSCIAKLTSVHTAIIKDIDKSRLKRQYHSVIDDNGVVKYCYRKVDHKVKTLGIDEFSLHKHHKYATTIMDLDTGEVLFVAYGRKKQVVYDFIEMTKQEYGEEFMKNIEAISSDMNSDYVEAFKEKYPKIDVVYDHFHIVKNFNDKVISKVRRDEYNRLWEEGKWQEADMLKNSKYLLMANYQDLNKKGQSKVDAILEQNQLLLLADIIKEQLKIAYLTDEPLVMLENIHGIIELCHESQNKRFLWFANLLNSHIDGIIMHAKYHISTGKVEGTNNKIKTIRRQAYGFHDDEYFFLKILDFTSQSHKKVR